MKTKEEKMNLMGLEEINQTEKANLNGGCRELIPRIDYICCMNIPPLTKPTDIIGRSIIWL